MTLNDKLKVAIVPLSITWNDRDENLYNASRIIAGIDHDTDIIVLPEMFSTGFIDDEHLLRDASETNDGPTMQSVRRWAAEANAAICGSFMARADNALASHGASYALDDADPAYFNRAFFVEPSGETTFYDKRHLLCIGPEARVLSAGNRSLPVVRFRGWNVSFCVCYDIRFPVWCRRTNSRPFDILLVPANWPDSRGYAWQHLLIARAIENQAVVVGANRSGADDYGRYDHQSHVFDCKGLPANNDNPNNVRPSNGASETPDDPSAVIYATLSKTFQETYRKKFPVQNDADTFTINL